MRRLPNTCARSAKKCATDDPARIPLGWHRRCARASARRRVDSARRRDRPSDRHAVRLFRRPLARSRGATHRGHQARTGRAPLHRAGLVGRHGGCVRGVVRVYHARRIGRALARVASPPFSRRGPRARRGSVPPSPCACRRGSRCVCWSARVGEPVVSTSANRTGEPPLDDAHAILREFGEDIDAVFERIGAGGAASTIVDFCGVTPRVVRAGSYAWDATGAGKPSK